MTYNPFDLLQLTINGHPIEGRPIEFSGTPNADESEIVKPTRVSTVCPDCGSGLEFSLDLPDPPFSAQILTCTECNPAAVEAADPFMNPLSSGRIAPHELDPLLHDPDNQVIPDDGKTVADRINEKTLETPPVDSNDDGSTSNSPDSAGHEEAKETPEKVPELVTKPLNGPIVPLEPAEIMGAEVDFDDDDLIETE